jgi:hypothetical protein
MGCVFCSAVSGIRTRCFHRPQIERVIFIPEADDDVAGSYDWYESREPGLEEDFLRSVEACVRGIQRRPLSMSFGERRFAAFHLQSQ